MLYLFLSFIFTLVVLVAVIYWQVQLIKKLSELAARETNFEVQHLAPGHEELGTKTKEEEENDQIPLEDMSPHERENVVARGLTPDGEKPDKESSES